MSAFATGLQVSEELKKRIDALRERRTDLRAKISCYVLFVRGVRIPDERLDIFGATSEEVLSRMVEIVSAELMKLEAEEPLKG